MGVNPVLPNSNVPSGQERASDSKTLIEYHSRLDIMSNPAKCRLTGIVCTIGPVSRNVEKLVEMIGAGMSVARMNFSHGSHKYHKETINNVRKACDSFEKLNSVSPCVSIALDTKGPEIRTGLLEGDDGCLEIVLKKGDKVTITTDNKFEDKCTKEVIWVDYMNIANVLVVGAKIFIDDGLISIVVESIVDGNILGMVVNGGKLGSRKGCNLPGTVTDLPAVSERDKEDILFGVMQGVDMVFASFIRNAAGVNEIKNIIKSATNNHILIIPKIENLEGISNIDEIIAASDGIMVARGDMGIEIPPEKVFIAQKQIIAKCNRAGKPVICATQMLESMVKNPRPTRAEASDVANAVIDGADCVMLSGETAKGDFPVECVKTMSSIAKEAESCVWNITLFPQLVDNSSERKLDTTQTVAIAAVQASYIAKATAIIVLTTSGKTAQLLSKYRPLCPIIAVTRFDVVARQLQLFRGIYPLYYREKPASKWDDDMNLRIDFAIAFGEKFGLISDGDVIVCVTGCRKGSGASNTIRIKTVGSD